MAIPVNSTMRWRVGTYEIRDGLLRVRFRDRRSKSYSPLECPELVDQFWQMDPSRREREILRFAKRYGHLGYEHLIPGSRRPGGERISWIWSHVTTVRTCLQLTSYLGSSSTMLEKYVRKVISDERKFGIGPRRESTRFVMRWAKGNQWVTDRDWREQDPRVTAQWIRRVLINRNLELAGSVYPQITDAGVAYDVVPTLLAVIYRHLVKRINNHDPLLCEADDCDQVFLRTDPRQRYCTETCQTRQRQRNYRANRNRLGEKEDEAVKRSARGLSKGRRKK